MEGKGQLNKPLIRHSGAIPLQSNKPEAAPTQLKGRPARNASSPTTGKGSPKSGRHGRRATGGPGIVGGGGAAHAAASC